MLEESGIAAAVLNHPANGIAWLANKLAPFGEGLNAIELVMAGSFTRTVPARASDTFHLAMVRSARSRAASSESDKWMSH